MTESTATPNRRSRLRRRLTTETSSGLLLLVAAAAALAWANSPWRDGYQALSQMVVGPAALGLDLSLASWAADGLLAVFFFAVGVELKHEFVAGGLRRPREAAVPMLAAVGGMALPAILFTVLVLALDDRTALHGWAIPTATDIAFALAVLAVFGRGLPAALRMFLLTLAVVDDLLAIVVIAVFYTAAIDLPALAGALVVVAGFALVVRLRRPRWWMMLPLAVLAWALMHASGVHPTIAGVLLGMTVPGRVVEAETDPRTTRYARAVELWSSAVALPMFAFFSAGVEIDDGGGAAAVLGQPVVVAIAAGLVIGKLVGVLGTTALVTRLTPLRLPDSIGMRDLVPVGFLTGIGFTVSLLITELSFPDAEHTDGAKVAILVGSAVAALLAAATLRWDGRKARRADMNDDGRPDAGGPLIGDDEA